LVDTVNGLGITHFNEMPVFAIDYDISSDQCYIPTRDC
jgi:hypothetical protein